MDEGGMVVETQTVTDDDPLASELREPPVVELQLDLFGSDMAVFEGKPLQHRTPILEWCRILVARGLGPTLPLTTYRDGRPAQYFRSIGEAAKLDVAGRTGEERFIPYVPTRQEYPVRIDGGLLGGCAGHDQGGRCG
jgi:hypothetical protein